MNEYVRLEEVIEIIEEQMKKRYCLVMGNTDRAVFNVLNLIKTRIWKLDIVEAEPVRHGRWEKICTSHWRWEHGGAHVVNRFKYKHNDCGKVVEKEEPYCPNCGAKMDGGAEE